MYTRRLKKLFAASVLACPLAWCAHSQAAPISYGNLSGANVMFLGVTEDSTTDPSPPNAALFGTPTVASDSLVFNPVSFGASAAGPNGVDITDGTLKATLMTTGTKRIDKVTFKEAGDYTIVGGTGTAATGCGVGASFFLQVVALDGVGIQPISFSGNLPVSPSGGTYDFVNDPHGPNVIWNGTVTFDIDTLLSTQNPPVVGQATKILLTLDNSLYAFSEAGTAATIKKKDSEGIVIIVDTNVPEPASLAFLGLGGFALLTRRRAE